jgi:hypothetical protein
MGIIDRLFRRESKKTTVGKTAPDKPKVIKTVADVRAFFMAATGDEALSKLLAEVADRLGPDGYLAIQQGSTGEPYSVEYMPTPEDDLALSDAENKALLAEYRGLRQQIVAATSAPERDELERKLGILTYCVCILYIRTPSSVDFRSRSDAIREAWTEFKEIVNTNR